MFAGVIKDADSVIESSTVLRQEVLHTIVLIGTSPEVNGISGGQYGPGFVKGEPGAADAAITGIIITGWGKKYNPGFCRGSKKKNQT